MEIRYDFEINIIPSQYLHIYNSKSGAIYNEIKSFIRQRWSVLEDELFKIDEAKVIIIMRHNPPQIKLDYFNIPMELINKMNDSLSQDDYNYLGNKINLTFPVQT